MRNRSSRGPGEFEAAAEDGGRVRAAQAQEDGADEMIGSRPAAICLAGGTGPIAAMSLDPLL